MRVPFVRVRVQSFLLPVTVALVGCELTEITLSTPSDVIVAEVILRAGELTQQAYLHRTAGTDGSARVYGAVITVVAERTGERTSYEVVADSLCVRADTASPGAGMGTCYRADGTTIRAGEAYSLRIEVEGRVMTGRLVVPGAFTVTQPAVAACALAANRPIELTWTQASGAWVYVTEVRLTGLRQALRRTGVSVSGSGPVELTGLSISDTDTTLAFPGQLGLFERGDDDLHPVLLAIRDGLPADVRSDVVIGAADRNYVNWVRGGIFNPSGQVRVPSVGGDGTGVFGALVLARLQLVTGPTGLPPCQ